MHRPAAETPYLKLLLFGWEKRGRQWLSENWPHLLAEELSYVEFAGLVGPAEAQEDHLARLNPSGGKWILRSLLVRGGRVSVWREPYRGDLHAVLLDSISDKSIIELIEH